MRPGFREALMMMVPGDHFTFEIPAKKGYGNKGKTDDQTGEWQVFPDSDLVYEVELINIKQPNYHWLWDYYYPAISEIVLVSVFCILVRIIVSLTKSDNKKSKK
mmetsp:Transcript_18944/g.13566  ORF Transcript_18944/g.13566 Transcript_18944/m.13566 type:complete len:104 (+) Transcript_18944:314-625(+)